MSLTQRYKIAKEFTLPAAGIPYLYRLIRERLDIVQKTLRDGNAPSCFSLDELSELAVECLTLAKLLDAMPKAEADHA